MKKINVRCRDEIPHCFKIDQLYGVLNKDNDIHINGSLVMDGNEYGNVKRVKIYANLCNKEGAILNVINGWKNYTVADGKYISFSLYCSAIGRFFDIEDLDYVELYLSINEKNS